MVSSGGEENFCVSFDPCPRKWSACDSHLSQCGLVDVQGGGVALEANLQDLCKAQAELFLGGVGHLHNI